jgi:hypothetical protein
MMSLAANPPRAAFWLAALSLLLGVSGRSSAQEGASPSAQVQAQVQATEEAEPGDESIVPEAPSRAGPPLDKVREALKRVEDERASTTHFWPWLAVGVGVGASVGSAAYGAIYAIDCDSDCSAPTWVSLVVVAGAAVAALSMIWLVRTDEDIRELESRKYHLERDLERLSRASRSQPARAQNALVTVHF